MIVHGDGNPNADIMFIGEAPGFYEDESGKPFVGRSGQLLDEMINTMGCDREDVYITNLVKQRPPDNRDPNEDEINQWLPILLDEIEKVDPKVIITLGKVASQTLLKIKEPMKTLRGQIFTYKQDIIIIPTYHPAYILRNPRAKELMESDLFDAVVCVKEMSNGSF